jgi:hypothetical protein
MEQKIPTGQTIDIGGKSYNLIVALATYIDYRPPHPDAIGLTYNAGMYLLQNPYPKDLPSTEPKPQMLYYKTTGSKLVQYFLLVNVKTIKLKINLSEPDPTIQPVSLYAGDTKVDVTQLGVWQDIVISFNKRQTMTAMYLDLKDKEHAPNAYTIRGEIDAWEFTS